MAEQKYRLIRGNLYRSPEASRPSFIVETIHKGDVFVPRENELKHFGNRMVKVEEGPDGEILTPEEPNAEVLSEAAKFSAMAPQNMRDVIRAAGIDLLDALEVEESKREKPRTTVLDMIQRRRKALVA